MHRFLVGVGALLATLASAASAGAATFPDGSWKVRSLSGSYAVTGTASDFTGVPATGPLVRGREVGLSGGTVSGPGAPTYTASGPYTESGTWRAVGGTVTPITSHQDLQEATGGSHWLEEFTTDRPVAVINVDVVGPAAATYPSFSGSNGTACPENSATFDWGAQKGRITILVHRTSHGLSFVAQPYDKFVQPGAALAGTTAWLCPPLYSVMGGSQGTRPGTILGNTKAAPDSVASRVNGSPHPGTTVSTDELGSLSLSDGVLRLVTRGTQKATSSTGSSQETSWDLDLQLVAGGGTGLPSWRGACRGTVVNASGDGAVLRSAAGEQAPIDGGTALAWGDRIDARGVRLWLAAGRDTLEAKLSADARLTMFPEGECNRFRLDSGGLGLAVRAGSSARIAAGNAAVWTSRVPAALTVARRRVGARWITDVAVSRGAVKVRAGGRTVTVGAGDSVAAAGRGAPR